MPTCLTLNETTPHNVKCPNEAKEFIIGKDEYFCLEVSKAPETYELQNNTRNRLHALSLQHLQALGIANIWSPIRIYDNFSVQFYLTNVHTELPSFRKILQSKSKKCFVENLENGLRMQASCKEEFHLVRVLPPVKLSLKSACPEITAAYIFKPTICVGVKSGS